MLRRRPAFPVALAVVLLTLGPAPSASAVPPATSHGGKSPAVSGAEEHAPALPGAGPGASPETEPLAAPGSRGAPPEPKSGSEQPPKGAPPAGAPQMPQEPEALGPTVGGDAPSTAAGDAPATAVATLTELRALYQEVGAAGEVHRATEKELAAQENRVATLTRGLAETRTQLEESRRTVGLLAREEYRTGGRSFSTLARLVLLGDQDPMDAFHQEFALDRAAHSEAATLRALHGAERRAEGLSEEATAALDTRRTLEASHREAAEDVRRRIAEVEELLRGLSAEELAGLVELEGLSPAAARRSEPSDSVGGPSQDGPESAQPSAREPDGGGPARASGALSAEEIREDLTERARARAEGLTAGDGV